MQLQIVELSESLRHLFRLAPTMKARKLTLPQSSIVMPPPMLPRCGGVMRSRINPMAARP
jgi:hypothetical protein